MPVKRWTNYIAGLAGAVLIVVPLLVHAQAQNEQATGTLVVKCVDASGQPLKDVRLWVMGLRMAQPLEEKSDKKGEATFKKLAAGLYRVVGRKNGFEPSYYEPVRIAANAQETVTLQFQPGDVNKKLYFEDPALLQQANQLFQEGFKLLQEQKYPEAAAKLSESLKIIPANPDGHYFLGIALIQQRKWDEGQKEVEAAVALNPDEPRYREVLKILPGLRLGDEGSDAMAQRDFKTAIAKYTEQLKLQPDNTDAMYNLALAYANDGQHDRALEIIRDAIKRKPDEAAYRNLENLIQQHKEQSVIQQAAKLLAEGDQLVKEGNYQAALEKYETGRKMLPKEEPAVWYAIGRCHANLNHPEEALAAYQQAVRLDPKKPEYSQALAALYLEQKRVAEAIGVYEALSQQMGERADEKLFELGKKYLADNNSELAIPLLEHVQRINPNHAESYYELGVYYYYAGDKAKAKPLLSKYVEIGKDQKHLEDVKALLAVIERTAKPAPPARTRRP